MEKSGYSMKANTNVLWNFYYSTLIPSGNRVSEVLRVAEKAFGQSAEPILIYCSTTSHELFVFQYFDIDVLSLELLTQSKQYDVDEGSSHVFLLIDRGKTSLFREKKSEPSKIKFLFEKQGLPKRSIPFDDLLLLSGKSLRGDGNIQSYKYTSTTEGNLTYDQTTADLVALSGNTVPLPAKTHHPANKRKELSDENEWSLKKEKCSKKTKTERDVNRHLSYHTCTVKVKDESHNSINGDNDWSLKRYNGSKKSKENVKQDVNKDRCTVDENVNNENMVTNFVPSVRAFPAGTPFTNVTNTVQEVQFKQGVDSNLKKKEPGEKQLISDEYLRMVCNKIKKKYLKPKTKKLIHEVRKLTTIPRRVHRCILTLLPAKRSGKSGRNRNQNSSSSRPTNGVPIQASDSTERDRNRPLVTSTTPVFSTGGPGPPTNPIPTTNLMDLDNERILRDRLRGVGNTVQVAPRYPEYADQTVRQRSFANWPSYTQQQAARLIIFGFYYTGQADLVRCFQCGIGLKDWSPGDEPLFEHVRHSPNCPFLQQLLGDELLGTYRDNLAEAQQRNETATSHGLNIQAPQTRARIVRHPDRATMRQRLDTFTGWPHTNGQPPQRLAEAGLFYTGTNDLCRCFTCDGGLQRWDKDDDPWLEHARWFPHCTYVREVKGQDYINLVLAAAEQAMREDEESVVIQGLQSTDLQTTDPMSTSEARSVIEMGYSKTAVQLAIHEYNGKNPTKGALSFSAADLVQILVGRQERGEEIPQDLPSEELGASGSSQQAATADPIVENRRLKHILKCLKCQENDCNMLLLPCTHHRLCEECAQNVTHCPVCGRKVEDKVKTFMS